MLYHVALWYLGAETDDHHRNPNANDREARTLVQRHASSHCSLVDMIVCMQRQVRLKCFQFQRSWFSSILNPISDDIGVLVQRHATPHCTLVEEDVCTILVAGNCRAVGWRLELSLYSFLIWS